MPGGTKRDDTLADAIARLRVAAGSHDKFAERFDPPTSRQTIIRWEKGATPTLNYRKQLIDMGVPAHLFTTKETRVDLEARLRRLEAEIATIRRLLLGAL